MSTVEWEPEWGTPEENDFLDMESLDGLRVGDRVEFIEDGDEDDGEWWFQGDEGVVVGFTHRGVGLFNDYARNQIAVGMEGIEGLSHVDPEKLEKI